jgi:hypothetical protein
MRKNQWKVQEDNMYAHWMISFPSTRMLNDRELWGFISKLLIAAEENKIMKILETRCFSEEEKKYYFNINRGESFIEFISRVLEEEGKLLTRQIFSEPYALTKICYYNVTGVIVEKEICFPGLALKENRPELDYWYLEQLSAIILWGGRGGMGYSYSEEEDDGELMSNEFIENGVKYRAPGLSIHTNTDIWFPKVMGGYDESYEDRGWSFRMGENGEYTDFKEGEWYDNSELALCHTPRLNKFIQRVKELTLEYDGVWTIDRYDTANNYHSQWNEDGIILDE